MKLIDKDKVVEKIEKNKNEMEPKREWHFDEYTNGYLDALKEILSSLDTIEVKEVDINKEISQFINTYFEKAKMGYKLCLRRTAKYFYDLGLKAQKGE